MSATSGRLQDLKSSPTPCSSWRSCWERNARGAASISLRPFPFRLESHFSAEDRAFREKDLVKAYVATAQYDVSCTHRVHHSDSGLQDDAGKTDAGFLEANRRLCLWFAGAIASIRYASWLS